MNHQKSIKMLLTVATLFVAAPLVCLGEGWEDWFYLLYKYEGNAINQGLGDHIYLSPDLNLDGYGDLLVAASTEDVGGFDSAGAVYVYSGFDGSPLYFDYKGEILGANFGMALGHLADTDSDGYPEFLVGAPGADNNHGKVYHYSAKDGSLIHEYVGAKAGDTLGNDLQSLGDADGDKIDDLLIGVRGFDSISPPPYHLGAVYVYSGATKTVLFEDIGTAAKERMGWSVCKMGDVDKDGYADFAYLSRNNTIPPADVGMITVRAGKHWTLVTRIFGSEPGHPFEEIGYGGDVNNDAWPDLLIGQFEHEAGVVPQVGAVYVYSGKDWRPLYTFEGTVKGERLGLVVSTAGDIDGDGYDDILAGAIGTNNLGINDAGAAHLYSGKDGSLMARLDGEVANSYLGIAVHGGQDINGDGLPDVGIGSIEDVQGIVSAGIAYIYMNKSLQATDEVSIGGILELNLRVPVQPLGTYYLGFSLGIDPGIPIGTRTLPLNWDLLFTLTFGNPLFSGTLDGEGKQQILLPIPNDPALSGLVFYAGFLTLDPQAPKGVKTISNPEEIFIQ